MTRILTILLKDKIIGKLNGDINTIKPRSSKPDIWHMTYDILCCILSSTYIALLCYQIIV